MFPKTSISDGESNPERTSSESVRSCIDDRPPSLANVLDHLYRPTTTSIVAFEELSVRPERSSQRFQGAEVVEELLVLPAVAIGKRRSGRDRGDPTVARTSRRLQIVEVASPRSSGRPDSTRQSRAHRARRSPATSPEQYPPGEGSPCSSFGTGRFPVPESEPTSVDIRPDLRGSTGRRPANSPSPEPQRRFRPSSSSRFTRERSHIREARGFEGLLTRSRTGGNESPSNHRASYTPK